MKLGLVASLARPGGNLTGVNFLLLVAWAGLTNTANRLTAGTISRSSSNRFATNSVTESTLLEVQAGAQAMGLQVRVLNVGTSREIDAAFAGFEHERPDALFVGSGTLFTGRRGN